MESRKEQPNVGDAVAPGGCALEARDGSHRPLFLSRRALLASAAALTATSFFDIGMARGAQSLGVKEIAPGVFVHQGRYEEQSPQNRGDIANASFVIGDEAVAVIDTLGSFKLGEDLHAAVRAQTDRPIRYVINTHMHPDHVFGNAAFKADKPEFVGHHKLARALAMRADGYIAANRDLIGAEAFAGSEIIPPTKSVNDKLTLDLGGRSLICEAQKTAHTDNDLIVTDTKTDTLFLGDLLFSVHVPTLDGSILGWLALLDELATRKAAQVVPGHGPHAMKFPDALAPEKRYLSAVAEDVRALIRADKTIEDAGKTAGLAERTEWKLFDQYHVRNVTAAFAELEWE